MASATKEKSPNEQVDSSNNTWGGATPEGSPTNTSSADNHTQEAPGNIRADENNDEKKSKMPVQKLNLGPKEQKAFNAAKRAESLRKVANNVRNAVNDPKQATKDLAKRAAAEGTKRVARAAAKGIDAATGGVPVATIVERLLENRRTRRIIIWTTVCTILLVLFIVFFPLFLIVVILGGGKTAQDQANQTSGNTLKLTMTKEAPANVANGANIDYKITYAFPLSAQDLTITDVLPTNVNYISSPATVHYDQATRTLTWKRSENQPAASGPGGIFTSDELTGSFTFTVKPTQNDVYVYNLGASGFITGASTTPGTGGSTGGTAPTANDCNGAYKSKMSQNIGIGTFQYKQNANFGDPKCTLTNFGQAASDPTAMDNLYGKIKDALTQTASDPNDLTVWKSIIPCESSYNANNFNPDSFNKYENPPGSGNFIKMGAYGLFQMNPHYAPQTDGTPYIDPTTKQPKIAGNTQYDRGDVDWETQVKNAINQNKLAACKWAYWGCAPASLTQKCIAQ